MDGRIVTAKDYFYARQYKQSSDVILKMIKSNDYQNNDKLYFKLGTIYMMLKQYEKANYNYQQSVILNDKNANAYLQLGKLSHYHFNNYKIAEKMYRKCLNLNEDHISCMFNLGKLMVTLNELCDAKALFKKCLKYDDTKASIYYHLALVLDKQQKKNNDEIIQCFEKSIRLQPLVSKYYSEFAIYSEKIENYNLANYLYDKALQTINYSDPLLLEKYSYFLINSMNDNKKALKYLKIACELDDEYEYDYDSLCEYESKAKQCIYRIELMVFDFDSTILYREPHQTISDSNVTDLKYILGGNDRINKFKEFFEENINNHVINVIFSKSRSIDIIYKSLKLLGLYKYTHRIIAIKDLDQFVSYDNEMLHEIIRIKDNYNLKSSNQILYISSNYKDIMDVSNECKKYFVDPIKSYPFLGLTLDDFNELNHIRDDVDYKLDVYERQKFTVNKSISTLKTLDESLLLTLTYEVINSVKYNKPIKSLKIVQRMQIENPKYFKYIEYCVDFRIALIEYGRDRWWTAGQHLKRILQIEQSVMEIWRRFGKCLSYLKHVDAANEAYAVALRINPIDYYTNFSFGYHLLMCGCYKESKDQFIVTKKVSKFNKMNASLLVGMARCCEELGQFDEAEEYYKAAVESSNENCYESAHYYYSCYLEKKGRERAAMKQIEICLSISPYRLQNILKMCDISLRLHDIQKFEFFMKMAIEIDQSVIYNYERYYKKLYLYNNGCGQYLENDEYVKISEVVHNVEFDCFWFDEIGLTIPKFNQYYDNFIVNNLNNIQLLLNDENLSEKLIKIIGIDDPIHFELIFTKLLKNDET